MTEPTKKVIVDLSVTKIDHLPTDLLEKMIAYQHSVIDMANASIDVLKAEIARRVDVSNVSASQLVCEKAPKEGYTHHLLPEKQFMVCAYCKCTAERIVSDYQQAHKNQG